MLLFLCSFVRLRLCKSCCAVFLFVPNQTQPLIGVQGFSSGCRYSDTCVRERSCASSRTAYHPVAAGKYTQRLIGYCIGSWEFHPVSKENKYPPGCGFGFQAMPNFCAISGLSAWAGRPETARPRPICVKCVYPTKANHLKSQPTNQRCPKPVWAILKPQT